MAPVSTPDLATLLAAAAQLAAAWQDWERADGLHDQHAALEAWDQACDSAMPRLIAALGPAAAMPAALAHLAAGARVQ